MHFLQIGLFGKLALQGLCNIVRALVKIHLYLVVHFWYFAGLVDSKRGSCGWAESQAEPLSSGLTLSEPTYATLVGTRFLPRCINVERCLLVVYRICQYQRDHTVRDVLFGGACQANCKQCSTVCGYWSGEILTAPPSLAGKFSTRF